MAEHRTAALLGQQRDRGAHVPADAVAGDRDAAAVQATLQPVLGDPPGHGSAPGWPWGTWPGSGCSWEHHRGLGADGELADEPVVGVGVAEDPAGAVEVEDHRQRPADALGRRMRTDTWPDGPPGHGGVLDVDGQLLDRAGLDRIDGPATLVRAELKQG